MGLDLIVTMILGLGVAGMAMLLRRLSGNRLPGYIVPAAAGIAMIGYAVWSEYTWYDRTTGKFPQSVTVISERAEPTVFRPWTYLAPFVGGFAAVDRAAVRTHPQAEGMVLTEVMIFDRLSAASTVPVAVDCPGKRTAGLADGATFNPDGTIADADWHAAGPGDPLLGALCPPTS